MTERSVKPPNPRLTAKKERDFYGPWLPRIRFGLKMKKGDLATFDGATVRILENSNSPYAGSSVFSVRILTGGFAGILGDLSMFGIICDKDGTCRWTRE